MENKKRIMTVDLEYDYETKNTESIKEVLPTLLEIFDKNSIKATFFTVSNLIDKHESEIKEISKKHEIASHSQTHPNLKKLTHQQLNNEIKNSKKQLESLKIKVKGFRAPYFITPKNMSSLLKKYNYEYDSSISTFFPGRYLNITTKTKPYKTNSITELPIPNFLPKTIPAGLSYYKLLYPLSKTFKIPYMLYLHPCELLKNKTITAEIPFAVRKFYQINSGEKAINILKSIIEKTYRWTNCETYIKENNRLNPQHFSNSTSNN